MNFKHVCGALHCVNGVADSNEHDLHFLTFKHVHSLLILCSFSYITLQIERKKGANNTHTNTPSAASPHFTRNTRAMCTCGKCTHFCHGPYAFYLRLYAGAEIHSQNHHFINLHHHFEFLMFAHHSPIKMRLWPIQSCGKKIQRIFQLFLKSLLIRWKSNWSRITPEIRTSHSMSTSLVYGA